MCIIISEYFRLTPDANLCFDTKLTNQRLTYLRISLRRAEVSAILRALEMLSSLSCRSLSICTILEHLGDTLNGTSR